MLEADSFVECSLYAISVSIWNVRVKGIHFPVTSMTDYWMKWGKKDCRQMDDEAVIRISLIGIYLKRIFILGLQKSNFLSLLKKAMNYCLHFLCSGKSGLSLTIPVGHGNLVHYFSSLLFKYRLKDFLKLQV